MRGRWSAPHEQGINDRLYTRPAERTGVARSPVTATGFRPVYGTRHIIAGQRVFVWQG